MKVLSVKQPWANLLCEGIKDIENRTWKLPEKYKGKRVLIHASGRYSTWNQIYNTIEGVRQRNSLYVTMNEEDFGTNYLTTLYTSAIIGSVVFTDCVINHPSVWAEETPLKDAGFAPSDGWLLVAPDLEKITYNWVASDPIIFDKPILNVRGKLNFWEFEPNNPIERDMINHILDDISI